MKYRGKRKTSNIRRNWTLVWLIAALSVSLLFVTFASYTYIKSVKRVATTVKSPDGLFSSNSMSVSTSERRITSTDYTVTVCNYAQNKPSVPNPADVSYTMTAELVVHYNGQYLTMSELQSSYPAAYATYMDLLADRTYTITKIEDDETGASTETVYDLNDSPYSASYSSQSLKGNRSSTDKFKVTFDPAEIEETTPTFYIRVTATADQTTIIRGYICAAKNTTDTAAWQGNLVENPSYDYDFYNYILSGSGKGTLDVMWDPAYLEINNFFVLPMAENDLVDYGGSKITDDTSNPGWKKITLNVDSTEKSRYEVQFYKVQEGMRYTGSYAVTNYIKYKFTKDNA